MVLIIQTRGDGPPFGCVMHNHSARTSRGLFDEEAMKSLFQVLQVAAAEDASGFKKVVRASLVLRAASISVRPWE